MTALLQRHLSRNGPVIDTDCDGVLAGKVIMNALRLLPIALGAGALAVAAAPAHALISTQTVGPYSFKTSGTTPQTTPISITPFSASAASTLTGVKLSLPTPQPQFGGQVGLVPAFAPAPVNFSATGTPSFTFSSSAGTLSTTASTITITPNSVSSQTVAAASGTFNGTAASGIPTFGSPTLQAYFAGSPQIISYSTTYSGSSIPVGGALAFNGGTGLNPTTLEGDFYIQYQYLSEVPAPLPIAGAAMAFAHTRRLRKRIKARQAPA